MIGLTIWEGDISSLNHDLRVALAAEVHPRLLLHLHGADAITHLTIYAGNGKPTGAANSAIQHAPQQWLPTWRWAPRAHRYRNKQRLRRVFEGNLLVGS